MTVNVKRISNLILTAIFLLIAPLFLNTSVNAQACNNACGSRGQCNSGLTCTNGKCLNASCPADTNGCDCGPYVVQGYKVEMPGNKFIAPAAGQTVYLDGGSPTTAEPYSFSNLYKGHTISVSVPVPSAGWSVGYTLCYNSTSCHTGNPTPGTSVTIDANQAMLGSGNPYYYADLWWHYTPPPASTPTLTPGSFNNSSNNPYTPVTITWTNGTGLQVWDSAGNWFINGSASSPTVVNIVPGRTVYARTTYDFLNFSSTASLLVPYPANPSPATISGPLQQKSGTGCIAADATHNFQVSNPTTTTTPSNCVSTSCSVSPGTTNAQTYTCTTTFNSNNCLSNNPPTWPITATVNLTGVAPSGYTFDGWTNSSCSSPNNTQTVNGGVSGLQAATNNTTQPITFDFSGTTWLKNNNSSFVASTTNSIAVPAWATKYPGSATDTGASYFIIGAAGSALGVGASPGTAYSSPNWNNSSYSRSQTQNMGPTDFANYIKSRKSYTPISALSDIAADGVYLWTGTNPLSINSLPSQFNNYNVVLVNATTAANGEVDVNTTFTPGKSIAIVTNKIIFGDTVTEADGLFIADKVDTGNNSNQGLLINGNLVVLDTSAGSFTNNRSWSNTSIPAIYVDFNSSTYLTLLPYLSIAKYNWQQLQ